MRIQKKKSEEKKKSEKKVENLGGAGKEPPDTGAREAEKAFISFLFSNRVVVSCKRMGGGASQSPLGVKIVADEKC